MRKLIIIAVVVLSSLENKLICQEETKMSFSSYYGGKGTNDAFFKN